MSDITRIEPGPRMTQAVVHGGTVYLAGQIASPGADVATQTRDILANVDRLLAEAGSSKSRILQAVIWLASMDDFAEMNAVWDAWVDPANTPARATGESRLATPRLQGRDHHHRGCRLTGHGPAPGAARDFPPRIVALMLAGRQPYPRR